MSESATSWEEIESRLIVKALRDPEFREALVRDPQAAITREGGAVPAGVSVKVVEESMNCRYLVLPEASFLGGTHELSSEMLATVTGSGFPPDTKATCTEQSWCC